MSHSQVTTFLGIPYARPPTREYNLRFKPPQIPTPWGSILADRYRNSCPQYIRYTGKDYGIPITDEDCLYMNIFTPWAASIVREPYPVMIYIHGGNFDHGSGNTFPGQMLAASQEVVVVTFNYRLGLLGFLATADNASAGNFGLLDQVQAINWVRENIRAFNGDADRITLFGPDAGAASAGLLALSPLTRKYVKKVIAQSGAAVADWAFVRNPLFMRNTSVVAGYSYGCRTRHTFNLVECLKSRSAIDFTTTEVKPDVGWLAWGPVVDHYTRNKEYQFMPDFPENLLMEKKSILIRNSLICQALREMKDQPLSSLTRILNQKAMWYRINFYTKRFQNSLVFIITP
jgi:neuroligin